MGIVNILLYSILSIIKCGCRKFTKSSSVYDIIEPMSSDGKGTIVSLISQELENMCRDYESLPDTNKKCAE